MIRIQDSLARRKRVLTPLEPGHVRMYVCGMTVYDYCHLGHARVLVVFDMVARYLRARGLRVTYVRNITDIDDKIIRRAGENAEPWEALTGRFIEAMHEDASALGVLPPDREPRATGHIDQIIDMIRRLEDGGYAYRGDSGDVYFEVRRFPRYGQLSGESPDSLLSGARIEADPNKRDPLDFVLWKAAKPGEPRWESPWGPGRPGWHIECSAMSTHCLGNHFDIHAGGMDLRFPHHENEIAQSVAATGEKFAEIWMHNGYVQIDQEKMSKSLGNFFTIREILAVDDNRGRVGEAIRFMILRSHYRSPLNFSTALLEESTAALSRLYRALDRGSPAAASGGGSAARTWSERFHAAMEDDFGTPDAIAVLFDLANEINRAEPGRAAELASELRELGGILGLLQQPPARVLGMDSRGAGDDGGAEIDALVAARDAARRERNWSEADRIRDELADRGVVLEDSAEGTRWRRT